MLCTSLFKCLDNIINLASILENKIQGVGRGLSPLEVKKMKAGDNEMVLIDVRTKAEFDEMRLSDARVKWISLGKLRSSLSEIPRDKKDITLCKTSLRGYEASRILSGSGLSDVGFMDGGIIMWLFEVDRSPLQENEYS